MTKQSWKVWLLTAYRRVSLSLSISVYTEVRSPGVDHWEETCIPEKLMEQPTTSMKQPTHETKRKRERKIPCKPKTRNNGKVRWPYPCSSSSPQISSGPLPYPCMAQTPSSTHIFTLPIHSHLFLSKWHPANSSCSSSRYRRKPQK